MIIEEHARLEIRLPDGRSFSVYESDIIADSLSVSKQCVNGSAFSFGCVSPAQLSVRFRIRDSSVTRYDMYGAEITLYRWFGSVPGVHAGKCGVYNVTSASKRHEIFTVSASDNIIWLDSAAFGQDDTTNSGSAYGTMGNAVFTELGTTKRNAIDAMKIIVTKLTDGLSFGVDEPDLTHIPNATPVFKGFDTNEPPEGYSVRQVMVLDDEQSDNLRDYVSWLAAYMGGFVIADRDGTIVFRLFQTAYYNEPAVLQYSDFQADSLEIAGFRISLYRNTVVTEDNNFQSGYYIVYPGSEVIYTEIMEKQNPFIEFIYAFQEGMEGFGHITGALLLYQYQIPICPFSGTYHGTQYLELGQYIRIMDENGNPCDTVITSILWKFRGGQQIRCTGEDARTLSDTRKRSQAIRTGERLKTQLLRLEDRVTSGNNQFSSDISAVSSRISSLEGQNLNGRISTLEGQNLTGRISALENQNLNNRIEELSSRITKLENGG